jgi:ribokinase
VIVIVGSPVGRLADGRVETGGVAARAAIAAAQAGTSVQVVGRVGDDPDADRLLLALATGGVGHVAILRDPGRATPIGSDHPDLDPTDDDPQPATEAIPLELDAADVDLGLRYLTDYRVVVLVPPARPEVLTVVGDAARWAAARLVVVTDRADAPTASLPVDAIVLEAPESDPDGAFATLLGRLAAALDGGADPASAFRDAVSDAGWAVAAPDA